MPEALCDNHASLVEDRFTCKECADPEVRARRARERDEAAARDRAAAEERSRQAAEREAERVRAAAERAAMPFEHLAAIALDRAMQFSRTGLPDHLAMFRSVSGAELAELWRRLGRERDTRGYKGAFGVRKVQVLGWRIAYKQNTQDPDSRSSDATSIYLQDDGRAVELSDMRYSDKPFPLSGGAPAAQMYDGGYVNDAIRKQARCLRR